MGAFVSQFFIPLNQLPDVRQLPENCVEGHFPVKEFSFAGFAQLAFLALAYGTIVCYASNLVAEGSELLLLIPKIAPLVGSVVLPVLGAVPDGAIVLFSGLGPLDQVQKQLSVGVGALAGSTIMLLTVPWFLSVVGGRVDLSPRTGLANYRAKPKLTVPFSATSLAGVMPDELATKNAAKIMLVTTVPYLLIQGAAHDTVQLDVADMVRENAVRKGMVSLFGVFDELLSKADSGHLTDVEEQVRFRRVVHHFFSKYDLNSDGSIDVNELGLLLKDMGLIDGVSSVQDFLHHFDANRDGEVSFDEFIEVLVKNRGQLENMTGSRHLTLETTSSNRGQYGAMDGNHFEQVEDEQEEEEEMPEDLANLPVAEQQRRIITRSLKMMGMGLLIIILFSDALVDVFSELGELLGVSGFYISFMLAPLASNASEIIASFNYSLRKTTKTITISLSTLMGAAILNNTFVLGIFLALIRFRGLDWEYSAETIAILLVELAVGIMVLTRRVHTVANGLAVLALFPLSLLLVAFLESSWVGLD
ncbi:hypothetical protein BASA81_012643 [Batrachochytrium salamandrivorans]|nr:hypothetical protein BASA81_012643 [Batrachochytrium salamandrivorans]